MSNQNKWAGSFGKSGDSASGGSKVQGGNVYKAPSPNPVSKSSSSVRDNVIKMKTGPGDNMGMKSQSSHNDINAFTRGIKSRGPYGGPSFASINTYEKNMQRSNTSQTSMFNNPSSGSAGGTRGTAGGSSAKSGGSKVGSGQAKMEQMAKASKGNKDGSGYMASVRK